MMGLVMPFERWRGNWDWTCGPRLRNEAWTTEEKRVEKRTNNDIASFLFFLSEAVWRSEDTAQPSGQPGGWACVHTARRGRQAIPYITSRRKHGHESQQVVLGVRVGLVDENKTISQDEGKKETKGTEK